MKRLMPAMLVALASVMASELHAATAQEVDRSAPPAIETSAGGFTIRRLDGPVSVDGVQWLRAQPNRRGEQLVNASAGQFSFRLAEPVESGDAQRFHLTFTGRDGKTFPLAPDPVSYAMVLGNRWILFEPLEVLDVHDWRRYSLTKQFGIQSNVKPNAVSADGRRLAFSRSDCAFDCPKDSAEWYEISIPAPPPDAPGMDLIGALVTRLKATRGMWVNGYYTPIELPATTPIPQVLAAVLETIHYDERRATTYHIVEIREVQVEFQQRYVAVLVETDLGNKIVLLRHTESGWWNRVYDE